MQNKRDSRYQLIQFKRKSISGDENGYRPSTIGKSWWSWHLSLCIIAGCVARADYRTLRRFGWSFWFFFLRWTNAKFPQCFSGEFNNCVECALISFGVRLIVCDIFAEVWAKVSCDWLILVLSVNKAVIYLFIYLFILKNVTRVITVITSTAKA